MCKQLPYLVVYSVMPIGNTWPRGEKKREENGEQGG
jgi:hypothetical protein